MKRSSIGSFPKLQMVATDNVIVMQTMKSETQGEICCRICLQQMSKNQVHSFCHCKGSNRHVHQKCLLEWIKRLQKYKESMGSYFCLCDICKGKIYLQTQLTIQCRTFKQIKQDYFDNFWQKEFCCTISITIIFIMSAFIMGVIIYFGTDPNKPILDQDTYKTLLGIALSILGIDVLVYILHFLIRVQNTQNSIIPIEQRRSQVRRKFDLNNNLKSVASTELSKIKQNANHSSKNTLPTNMNTLCSNKIQPQMQQQMSGQMSIVVLSPSKHLTKQSSFDFQQNQEVHQTIDYDRYEHRVS